MQLEPGEYFGIVRQLADPSDAGTYYIRAIVRDARTDTTLDTVDLASKGSGRYSAEWRVYATGKAFQGMYISITTYVYDDSGYTTLSASYGAESETYLLEPRAKHTGGGGSSPVNYNKISEIVGGMMLGVKKDETIVVTQEDIRKIVEDVIGKLDIPVTNIAPVIEAIRGINMKPNVSVSVGAPVVDTDPIASKLGLVVAQAIAENLSVSALQTITDALVSSAEKKVTEVISKAVEDAAQSIRESAKKIEESMVKDVISATVGSMKKSEEPVHSPFQGMSTADLIKHAIMKKK